MSVVAIDAAIGDRTLRTLNYNYSSDTGRLNRIQVHSDSFPLLPSVVVHWLSFLMFRDSRGNVNG